MRLHRLRLRAIGPFAGEHVVDFEPLTAGGLFLLDGPTGAGKSTLLDALTFALYGPGERAGDGRLQSHFADRSTRPEVELEFSVRGVRSRVTRTPEFARPKRRGDGFTVEKATVHLERLVDGRWESRSANKAEVGELIGEELGLTREQFTQVVLLPQGEFMRFLRAGDDERRGLLTKLFGTQLYDRITEELDRRRQAAVRELEAVEARVRSCLAATAQAAGLDDAERDVLLAADDADCAERLTALEQHLAAAAQRAATDHATSEAERERQLAARDRAAAERDLRCRFRVAVDALAAHERGREDAGRARHVLDAAVRAEPVRPLVTLLDEARDRLAEAAARIPAQEPHAEIPLRAEDVAADAARLTAEAAELGAFVELERDLELIRRRADEANEEASAARDALGRLARQRAELPARLRYADEQMRAARTLAESAPTLAARVEGLLRQRAAADELATLAPQLDRLRAALRDAVDQAQRRTATHLQLIERRLSGMAAELAAGLTDGTACPVCGAVEHPTPARPAGERASADEVAAAATARDRADAARRELEQRCAEQAARAAELTATITAGPSAADTADALTGELRDAELSLQQARDAGAAQADAEAERSRVEALINSVEHEFEAASRRAAQAGSLADELARQRDELYQRVAAARGDAPSVSARRHELGRQAAELRALAERVAAVEQAEREVAAATSRASDEAAAAGFGSLHEARAAVLAPEQVGQLRALVAEWEREGAVLAGRLADVQFAGLDPARAAELEAAAVAADAVAAARLAEAARSAADAAATAVRAADTALSFASCRESLAAAHQDRAAAAERAAPVIRLAQLAKGMAGQRRVALTTYVLRQWFESVVDAANLRLAGMSSGRYQLVRVDEAASKSERAGLTLRVFDQHTGEQRSPRSLSGGETFYTSLALALGLADVVRAEAGGIDLDTLFIDEGFGSLDADTLEEVMTVLDDLRDRGRTVGIVSHVGELKERIAERVEVRRLPDGSSTLRVVA